MSSGSVDGRPVVRKALVIGMDGADWQIVDPLLEQGELPNLARLLKGGVRAPLRTIVPAITFAAWPSLITGKNPGWHGIYSYWAVDPSRYDTEKALISSRPIVGRTIFDHLGSLGLRVCAYQVPMTYPAWRINGDMVAGFPTPDMGKAYCCPPELAEWVPSPLPSHIHGERIRPAMASRNPGEYLERLTQSMERFLAEDAHDFYMVVENVTDFASHIFWRLHDPTFPTYDRELARQLGDPLTECYRLVDGAVGRLLERTADDWVIVVVSDHGSCRAPTKWFHPNAWLLGQGLLRAGGGGRARAARAGLRLVRRVVSAATVRARLVRFLPRRLARRFERARSLSQAVDWTATRAYCVRLEPRTGGIMINLRGRQPNGLVEPGAEYEQLCAQLSAGLRELRDSKTGQPLVTEVWRRDELYQGPFAEQAPDIIYYTAPDYRCGDRLDRLVDEQNRRLLKVVSGHHTRDGILALRSPGIFRQGAALEGANILDVVPTLYHAMGLAVPEDAEGTVLLEAFEPAYLAEHPVRTQGALAGGSISGEAGFGSEQEEEGVRLSLRALGYVE